MLVTFCFCLGNINDALSTPTGYPFIQVFYAVTGSHAGTSIMTCILVVLAICGCICNVATASRQMWAFARDRGLPFSGWLSQVRNLYRPVRNHEAMNSDCDIFQVTTISGNPIPLNSLIISFVITVLLSLINIGSTIAFNNIVSLGVAALISSYAISVSCLLIRKLRHPETLPPARWTMGKYGVIVNAIAAAYLMLVFIMSFFPQAPNPVPATFNWSIVIYGAVVLWAAAYFVLDGRKVYHGPVVLCRRLD